MLFFSSCFVAHYAESFFFKDRNEEIYYNRRGDFLKFMQIRFLIPPPLFILVWTTRGWFFSVSRWLAFSLPQLGLSSGCLHSLADGQSWEQWLCGISLSVGFSKPHGWLQVTGYGELGIGCDQVALTDRGGGKLMVRWQASLANGAWKNYPLRGT